VSEAKLPPPVIPRNFYAAELNYRAHIEWANRRGAGHKVPEQPDVGYRSASALTGSGHDIVIPADSPGPVEYEGELVAVIGRRAKNLWEENSLDCVRGYTLGNDVSERSRQRSDRTLWRAKSADTFKPTGPGIVFGIDPMNQVIEVRVKQSHRVELQHQGDDLQRRALDLAHVALCNAVSRRYHVVRLRRAERAAAANRGPRRGGQRRDRSSR
jgi:2-keto-4-pentenoate hydratase/2-oxohepta-3-ene-1,7-dioic acid hydratase in catechol pathway